MTFQRLLSDADQHRTYAELHQAEVEKCLDEGDSSKLDRCIVKLEFEFNGRKHIGTGFYVNLPSRRYHVILTAGHNLINSEKVKAKNLVVIQGTSQDTATEVRICPQYEGNPGKIHGMYDYGVILLPIIRGSAERPGFGLNLSFSSNKYLGGINELYISGYSDSSKGPLNSLGRIGTGLSEGQVVYKAKTEQGMSGSPIWHGYGGFAVAVGIHNMRPEKASQGSRGTQITEEVFNNICQWSETGYFSKRLRADVPKAKAPQSHNIYFAFTENSEMANVFLGTRDKASTKDTLTFDILPTYVSQTSSRRPPLWAFRFHQPSSWDDQGKKWVEWQPKKQRAILVDSLKDVNLIKLRIKAPNAPEPSFKVVLQNDGSGSNNMHTELRLHDDNRDEEDVNDGMDEFSGVSFICRGLSNPDPTTYENFRFEDSGSVI